MSFDAILTIGIAMLSFDEYVIDVLMPDLAGHDRRPTSFLVYLWLAAGQARRSGPVQVGYLELQRPWRDKARSADARGR
jgi:hypothetical protein